MVRIVPEASASEKKCDPEPRAVEACSVHAHRPTEIRAEHRSLESERAETAYVDWSTAPPSDRPLAAQRPALARILFEVLKAHGVSRLRLADMIGVNEKQVRKMLDGRAPIPMATLGVLPIEMALDFMDRIVALRGGQKRSAADRMSAALAAVEREGAEDTLILDWFGRLGALSRRSR